MNNNPTVDALANVISQLDDQTADALMVKVVKEYAERSVDATTKLLDMIPIISKIQMKHLSDQLAANSGALYWLMVQHETDPDPKTLFTLMTPVCMVMFPNGRIDSGHSDISKKYFLKYLELFKSKFRWEDYGVWASIYNYTDYLKLIESNLTNND